MFKTLKSTWSRKTIENSIPALPLYRKYFFTDDRVSAQLSNYERFWRGIIQINDYFKPSNTTKKCSGDHSPSNQTLLLDCHWQCDTVFVWCIHCILMTAASMLVLIRLYNWHWATADAVAIFEMKFSDPVSQAVSDKAAI